MNFRANCEGGQKSIYLRMIDELSKWVFGGQIQNCTLLHKGGRLEYGGMREIRIEAFSQWLDAASANNQKGLLPDIKLSFLMSYHEPSSSSSSASYSVMRVGVFSANCNYDGDKRGLIKTRNCYLANIHPGFWWSCVIPSPPKMPVLSRRGFSTTIISD